MSSLNTLMAHVKALSLNCHGFNLATALYLGRVSHNVDVILLRETWLSDSVTGLSAKIYDALPEFLVFHSSAMENE